jgi:phosphoglycolate phosphatase-like HAD superfamily hydrolase
VLLLFDIDGTLLQRASREHAEALFAAMASVYGISDPPTVHVQAAGRTDLQIARDILLGEGVSAERIEEGFEDLRAIACEEFAHRCPADLSGHLVSGMRALLDTLAARAGVRLALLTGNLEPIARLKVARAGIARLFPAGQGGFGSDSEDRSDLPAIARRRADGYPRARTLVIGDTPRDIACARADGVRCLAIATGPYRAEELRGADGVAKGAGELAALLEAELARGM